MGEERGAGRGKGRENERRRQGGCQVRGTKYEVFKLGATELRRGVGRRQSRNDARGVNPCTREVGVLLVCGASVTRMGISMAALPENCIGTG